jgi:hypothetical protein
VVLNAVDSGSPDYYRSYRYYPYVYSAYRNGDSHSSKNGTKGPQGEA